MSLTAAEILAIPLTQPERLFSAPGEIHAEYRALSKLWHPNSSAAKLVTNAAEVFTHIKELHNAGVQKAARGTWSAPGSIVFKGTDGKSRRLRYRKHHEFELGDMYYGPNVLAYVVKPEHAVLFTKGVEAIQSLRYHDAKMREEFSRYFPVINASIELDGGSRLLVMNKTEDVFLLSDVIAHFGGRLDQKHVAWIGSRLLNIACYLESIKMAHLALSPENIFISPKNHSALVLGGWWYARHHGDPITHLPTKTHRIAPPALLKAKTADMTVDRALIRAVMREAMGDITGMSLSKKTAPAPFIEFLKSPARATAVEDYAAWPKVLESSWGPRRFHQLDVSESDIFKD